MGKLVINLTTSLDGFIAGADDGPDNPLGRGGEALFTWMTAGPKSNEFEERLRPTDKSKPIVAEWMETAGAFISGRRTFEIAGGWQGGHPFQVPVFVVTHEAPTHGEWGPNTTFVTDGVKHAIELAHDAAGDRTVSMCGASIAQQALQLGMVDEIQVSVTPVLLGSGVRLFDNLGPAPVALEQKRIIEGDGVTHLEYRVIH